MTAPTGIGWCDVCEITLNNGAPGDGVVCPECGFDSSRQGADRALARGVSVITQRLAAMQAAGEITSFRVNAASGLFSIVPRSYASAAELPDGLAYGAGCAPPSSFEARAQRQRDLRAEARADGWFDVRLYECAECSAKPGSPALCTRCLQARAAAGDQWQGPRKVER